MRRTVTIGAFQVKNKPRPLVGTKTSIRETELDMKQWEWSENFFPSRFERPYVTPWHCLPKPPRTKKVSA